MKCWPIILLCLLAGPGFGEDSPDRVLRPGDYILVKGRVRNCEDWGEFTIDYGYVEEEQAIILDHVLPAAGLRPAEFEERLAQAITDRIGRAPRTLRIEVLSEDVCVARQWEIEEDIRKYYSAIKACDRKMDEFRDKTRNVAS